MGNNHKYDPPEKFCLWCEKSLAFKKMQAQVKFCGERCRRDYRKSSGYFREKYLRDKNPHLKKCIICHKSILEVGKRKGASKYCSNSCMYIGTKVRDRSQEYVYFKVKVKDYPEVVRTVDALKRVGLFIES
tara:strand:- start:1106 stop:1498 length:393 start_codon:yes stop_codon:yes gene_type:complete